MENFTPLLTTFDWNEEWKELQRARRRADDASYWNERAKTFGTKDAPNPYVTRFLELAAVQPGETVFDMGCGNGALSIPLGNAGHKVVAADFSQGMLDSLQATLDAHGITTVFPKLMSWEEDWEAHGVRPGMVDVCVASRSIATGDIKESLLRLNETARRRVCVTLTTGSSPRTDDRVLAELGIPCLVGRDYLYAFNILAREGLNPEVSYISSARRDSYDSKEEAFESYRRMIEDSMKFDRAELDDAAFSQALTRLEAWLENNIVDNERAGLTDDRGGCEKKLRPRMPRQLTWAFISWNK